MMKFTSQSTQFSLENALSLARCSDLAYKPKNQIDSFLIPLGYSVKHIDHEDTQLFIASNSSDIVISFRGTSSIKDWLTDAKLTYTNAPDNQGKVHAGFYEALNHVWSDIVSHIKQTQKNAQAIWITGHSLGGALATLAAAKFKLELDKPIRGIYTFGQPRVGDRSFARVYNAELQNLSFRFVNNNDVVTRVPPRELLYSHIGSLRYIDDNKDIHQDISFWQEFLDRVEGVFHQDFDWAPSFAECHFIEKYCEAIEKNLTIATSR
ncbi:MAG: hypothetical protein RLZZ352_1658 [Pseudomonadota bacterium]|jgi:triacylglycerol lipase